jgi:hypothetical protein
VLKRDASACELRPPINRKLKCWSLEKRSDKRERESTSLPRCPHSLHRSVVIVCFIEKAGISRKWYEPV